MSVASKATALFVGAAGTLTIGGAILFGAMVQGTAGPGASAESEDLSGVIAIDDGLGGFEEEPQPLLLAQAEEVQLPAAGEKDNVPAESDVAQAGETTEGKPDEAMDPAEEEAAPSGGRAQLIASFRQLSAKDRKVYEALDTEITLEFPDNTIGEIMSFVGETSGVRVRMDEQALSEAGLDAEARVNFVGTHSLDDGLSMLLENINGTALDYYVERGVLHITTSEDLKGRERLRFYDLLGKSPDSGIENLAQAVQEYANELVDSNISVRVTSLGDSLAIQASLESHKHIEEFIAGAFTLADARRAAGRPLPVVPPRALTSPEAIQPAAQAGGGGGRGGGGFFSIPGRGHAH